MELLVSVSSAEEASAALAGGAQIIDAKDPAAGALGPVRPEVLRSIDERVAGACPLSAALGDWGESDRPRLALGSVGGTRLSFVKVGFTGRLDRRRVTALLSGIVVSARQLTTPPEVIAVAYADWRRVGSLPPEHLGEIARSAGAQGILIDTAFKDGAGLFDLFQDADLSSLVARLREGGLRVALAGSLRVEDLERAAAVEPDFIGVRGAACDGGRLGRISSKRVRLLRERLERVPC